jgi:hypothetical protein
MKKTGWIIGIVTGILLATASYIPAENIGFLKGKVRLVEQENLSLVKKIEKARKAFQNEKEGLYYFTGYSFPSTSRIDRSCYGETKDFIIKTEDNEIRIASHLKGKEQSRKASDRGAILFLQSLSEKKGDILDIELIDMERSYTFKETPVYWLGEAEAGDSLELLRSLLEKSSKKCQQTLVFTGSLHDTPKSSEFLKAIALGKFDENIRRNAIFWYGQKDSLETVKGLLDIYEKTKEPKLKEHVIFSLQRNEQKEAISALIRIAKREQNDRIKKRAIFWLGHKATKECAEALGDVIEETENIQIKKQALFAISRLPKKQSLPMLVEIVKTNKNPLIRKQALFWLARIDDERTLELFEEILLKK